MNWEQISKHDVCKDNYMSKHRALTALPGFTHNYLYIDEKQFSLDTKRIRILRNLRRDTMILKPDKGQGVVLISKSDYYSSLSKMFADKRISKVAHKDSTLIRLSSLQAYLNTLFLKRGELSDEIHESMRPKSSQVGRAHDLQKIHEL